VPLDELADLLVRSNAATAIVEQPPAGQGRSQEFLAAVRGAASAAGAQVVLAGGVPAEGLRRLYSTQAPQAYLEPVYLRGFL
jgi:hypothetical protein